MRSLIPRPQQPRLEAPYRAFGAYLRARRQAKHIKLRTFAEAVGLAPGHYSNIENARATPPGEETLIRMAHVLDVPVSALLARAGKLGPDDLHRFWSSPAIPGLIVASTGWSQEDVAVFVEIVRASLPQSTPA